MSRVRKGKLITVEIDIPLYNRIRQLSRDTGISISFKIREALEVWSEGRESKTFHTSSDLSYEPDADFGA